jgi:hypothetical protein
MSMSIRLIIALLFACGLLLGGCSEDPAKRDKDGSADTGGDGTPTEGGTQDLPAGPALMGVIKDGAGEPVEGVMIDVDGTQAFSDSDGKYVVASLTAGAATAKFTQDWFQEKTESVTIQDTAATTLDVTMDEHPLKLDPADKTLADTYNKTFDWTTDTVSIVVMPKPTRKELDNAIYFHNPALYRDTSGDTLNATQTLPSIGTSAKDFDFEAQNGKQVLDAATIKDKLDDTALDAAAKGDWMMWKPLLTYLKDWDAQKAADINDAGVAVRQQTWGDQNAVRPQDIERVYLYNDELWVEVVFEGFVKVGSGITDSDGDGRKEVFGKMAADHYSADVIKKVKDEYLGQAALNTHGMSKEINHSLNELYTSTAAEVEKYIGQQYDLGGGKGTISYPFVVLKHSNNEINVLLVGPGT